MESTCRLVSGCNPSSTEIWLLNNDRSVRLVRHSRASILLILLNERSSQVRVVCRKMNHGGLLAHQMLGLNVSDNAKALLLKSPCS
jgi:hypothetical protein